MPYAIASDGIRLHYELFGKRAGEPVLMIQGLGADARGWGLQRWAIGRRYRVIVFDNRGVGRSDKPAGDYDLAQMAEDALAVLDAAGYEHRTRHGRVDGRCDRADHRGVASASRAIADPRVHRLSPSAVAARAARGLGGDRASTRHARVRVAQPSMAGRLPVTAPLLAGVRCARPPSRSARPRIRSCHRCTPFSTWTTDCACCCRR